MFDFIKRNRLRILIFLIFIIFFFVLITQTDKNRHDNWITSTVQNITYPFLTSSRFIVTSLQDFWTDYIYLIGIRQEYKQLKGKLKELEAQAAKNREILLAYERQRLLLNFQNTNTDQKIFAEVIGEVQKGFSKLFVINKGYNQGIRKNFAVVNHEGIIGKIQSATAIQSIVQLIIDSRSQFPVLIQRTRTKAMLHGSFDSHLIVKNIPRRLNLYKNDIIISSGLEGIYPKGFPVGKVQSIEKKDFGLFQTAILLPAVDFSKVEEVTVILKATGNIHQPLFTQTAKVKR